MASKQLPVTPYQTSGFKFEYEYVPTHQEVITHTEYDQYTGHVLHHVEVIEVPDQLQNAYQDPHFEYVEDINFKQVDIAG